MSCPNASRQLPDDAYGGDIRRREEVSNCLAHDVRQGPHARKVMASYQSWFGAGPELSVLCLLGLFHRPAGEQALGALLKPPAIPGLTESLIGLSPSEWRAILAKLRRARLLAGEDPHHPGQLDAHPLVREYFGDQLRGQRTLAWQEANRRLYHHYREMAPPLPESVRAMEPLFLAVACGCQAGLLRDALHEVYLPRIQRGNASFAAKLLGARGALVSILAHLFESGRRGSPVRTTVEGQNLSEEDQLCILMQATTYLTATRGFTTPEARVCSEGVESLCHSLHRPLPLYAALMSQWRYSLATGRLTTAMQLAQRISSLAQEQNHAALMVGAYRALVTTLYGMGKFECARQHARLGLELWRSGVTPSPVEEVHAPEVLCLCWQALPDWHLREIASCHQSMAQAIAPAKELQDTHALAMALISAAHLKHFERDPEEVERLARRPLSCRHV